MKIDYRPEIDGLRAIAVISVILYHAQITLFGHEIFQGGFIGVDIFFVISGYLISSIILKELKLTGSFSFKSFYERRARRILPVLLFVMIVSLPFGWIFLDPSRLTDFLNSIFYSLTFISNFYFHFSSLQYGAIDGLFEPFLHTWSLSVEEQFYIIFPIIITLVYKYQKRYLGTYLIIAFLISFAFADWSSRRYISISFYSIHTRFWEILIGVILAYYETKYGRKIRHNLLNSVLVLFGLIFVLSSIFIFNNRIIHPSIYTLFPVLGVSLVVWFSHKDDFTTKILSSKLFVSIGLISYSLYLWHYPVFAFSRTTDLIEGDILKKIILALTIVLLSIFTYFYIERPARDRNNNFIRIFKFILLSYIILILNFGIKNFILNDKNLLNYNIIKNDKKNWSKCTVSAIKNDNYCKIGNFKNKVYLIGDSHTIPLSKDLGKKLNKINYSLVLLYEEARMYKSDKENILNSDKRYEFLKNIQNSIFIFAGYYQRLKEDHLSSLFKIYEEDFQVFQENNNKIIFLKPIPEIPLKFNLYEYKFNENYEITQDKDLVKKKLKLSNFYINNLKNINIVSTENAFCDENLCFALKKEKQILKSDYDHPSLAGSKLINNLIIKKIIDIE